MCDPSSVLSQHKVDTEVDLENTYLMICQSYHKFHRRCKHFSGGQSHTEPQLVDREEGLVIFQRCEVIALEFTHGQKHALLCHVPSSPGLE